MYSGLFWEVAGPAGSTAPKSRPWSSENTLVEEDADDGASSSPLLASCWRNLFAVRRTADRQAGVMVVPSSSSSSGEAEGSA